jgi:hypothetical protein
MKRLRLEDLTPIIGLPLERVDFLSITSEFSVQDTFSLLDGWSSLQSLIMPSHDLGDTQTTGNGTSDTILLSRVAKHRLLKEFTTNFDFQSLANTPSFWKRRSIADRNLHCSNSASGLPRTSPIQRPTLTHWLGIFCNFSLLWTPYVI